MVDRLQYQNQNFGSQVQPSQPQLTSTTAQPPRQILNNTVQIRHIQTQPPKLVAVHSASTQRTWTVPRPLRSVTMVQGGNQQIYFQPVQSQQQQQHRQQQPQQGQFVQLVNGSVRGGIIKPTSIRTNPIIHSQMVSQHRQPYIYQTVIKPRPGQSFQQQQPYGYQQTQYIRRVTPIHQTIRQVEVIKQEDINGEINGITVKNEYTEVTQIPVLPKIEPIEEVYEQESLSTNPKPFSSTVDTPSDSENINIVISNVVCNYSLPMHIDLRKLALNSWNCSYDRAGTVLTKQKRHPGCYVKVYSTGKVYIVGCKSEAESRQAARSVGREIQRIMGKTEQKVSLRQFRINNILATCKFPFGILIDQINRQYPKETYYEPELTIGLIWRMTDPKASVRIHTTGTIVITGATSELDVQSAVAKIYDYVKDFRCDPSRISHAAPRKRRAVTNDEFNNIQKRQKLRGFEDDDDDGTGMNHLLFEDEYELDEI